MPDSLVVEKQADTAKSQSRNESTHARRIFRLKLRYALFAMGAVLLLVGGAIYWLSGGRYIVTDDAYVQGNVLDVSTDVSGLVERIAVHDGERVTEGQELFRLDPERFQLAVDQAKANLAQTALQLNASRSEYRSAQAQVAVQQANVEADRVTYQRIADLVTHNAASKQQYDDARYKLAADEATSGVDQANAATALARLGGNADLPTEQMPSYRVAAAQLGQAERDLRQSVVRAPFAGIVIQVSKLQPGEYLAAGAAAMGLVGSVDMWIAAQPKETDLTYAHVGDPATVTVGAYPGHLWHGELQSVAPATDQQFAILPAQNSSGNWVKVVQRVPLRVAMKTTDSDPPLSAGMSAQVSIDTHHHRSLRDLF